jgi:hypothetical protein
MTEMENYWSLWSRYWPYIEDFFLDIDVIDKLATSLESPVLIVGAGQGMLVEELQKKGFQVDGVDFAPNMVAYAKDRRGIDLIQANGKDMPFTDRSYKTSVIATGVIDFMEDEKEIESIINETRRVTDDLGKVFATFYQYHPKGEKLLRYGGLITDNGLHRYRRFVEMTKLSCDNPIGYIRAFKSDANVGFLSAFITLIKVLLFLPKKEKRARKRLVKMWKEAINELDNPEALIDCVPEFIPYRREESIRDLLNRLNIPIHGVLSYDSCIVVQLGF